MGPKLTIELLKDALPPKSAASLGTEGEGGDGWWEYLMASCPSSSMAVWRPSMGSLGVLTAELLGSTRA